MKKITLFLGCAALFCGCSSVDTIREKSESRAYEASSERRYAPPVKKGRATNDSVAVNGASGGAYFQQSSRMMAYTAGFTLVVKKQDAALDEMKKLAESYGGYLLSSARGNMVLKVPVARADEFLKKSGNVGKMSDFRISAEDLTDIITDLDVRLTNLRKLQTRLRELLAKASKVDEIIKVERELNRVTTEIERLEAQLQNNKNRVDFVTFNVAIIEEHGAIPAGTPQAIDYFSFLTSFACAYSGVEDEPCFGIELPGSFVRGKSEERIDGFTAISGDDCIFRTWSADIPDGGTLKFWETMVCRALTAEHKYNNVKCFALKFNGMDAVKITAEQTTARGIQRYMAVIAIERNYLGSDQLQIVEFFGPEEAFKKHEKSVTDAILK